MERFLCFIIDKHILFIFYLFVYDKRLWFNLVKTFNQLQKGSGSQFGRYFFSLRFECLNLKCFSKPWTWRIMTLPRAWSPCKTKEPQSRNLFISRLQMRTFSKLLQYNTKTNNKLRNRSRKYSPSATTIDPIVAWTVSA